MNIFHKIALRGMQNSRARTMVTIIGVALSTALITAVITFGISLLNYAAEGAAQKYGAWQGLFWDVNEDFVQKQNENTAVAQTVQTETIGYAMLCGGVNVDKPYLYITSFDEEAFAALPISLLSGRLPENSSEILIASHVAANGGVELSVGDQLTLGVGQRMAGEQILSQQDAYAVDEMLQVEQEQTYTVVGIYLRPSFETYTAPGYTAITKTDAATTADRFNLFVTLHQPQKIRSYMADTANGYDYSFNNKVLRFWGLSEDSADTIFNTLLYAIGGVVLAIVIIGSVFLIYNGFSISLNERMQQIGMLTSVGATAGQLRSSVLFEGLCIGIVGIPIGILLGLCGMQIVIWVVAQRFNAILYDGVPLVMQISVWSIVGTVLLSLLTIFISAYIPAAKASNMPVMACIRQSNEATLNPKCMNTPNWMYRFFGLEGMLALKNFRRNRKRYGSVVLSLVLSVVLFVSASAFVLDLRQTMEQAAVATTYDIGLGTQDMSDAALLNLYDSLKQVNGVYESAYQAVAEYRCDIPADRFSEWAAAMVAGRDIVELPMEIHFLDDAAYQRLLADDGVELTVEDGQGLHLFAVAKLRTDSGEDTENYVDLFDSGFICADIMPVIHGVPDEEQEQAVSVTLVGLQLPDIPPTQKQTSYSEQREYIFEAVAPWSLKAQLEQAGYAADCRVKGITFCSAQPSQSVTEIRQVITDAGITDQYFLLNFAEILEENESYIFIANVFAYTFIVIISLIAIANVFNTISTSMRLRRHEFAMLRSVGMSDRAFRRMLCFECLFYGMKALVWGLPLSVLAVWLIYSSLFFGGADRIQFIIPWGSMGISVCSVLIVIGVTMMYSVRKMKTENIMDVLGDALL